jgi:hypothetical protein
MSLRSRIEQYIVISASARISKGQGYHFYQGFLKGKGQGAWPKKGNLHRTRKNGQNLLLLVSIKCFPISFNTFIRHF